MEAIGQSDVVVGYRRYLELIADLTAGKEVISSGMTEEVQRCRLALKRAAEGRTVALVSSGDAGIYGMAGLAMELAEAEKLAVAIEVIPGVTAASAAAAALGAPLMLDFAAVSLSDLLVPWETIRRRLEAVAAADLVTALYNPRSAPPHPAPGKKRWRSFGPPGGLDPGRHRHRRRPVAANAGHRRPGSPVGREGRHDEHRHHRQQPDAAVGRPDGHVAGVSPMILLLGGTGSTAELALALAEAGYRVLVSKATDVPLDVGQHARIESRWGELDDRGLAELIVGREISRVVDATHPYATVIRGRARRAAGAMQIPYFSFLRPGAIDPQATDVQWVAGHAAAAEAAFACGKPVLLTTGAGNLRPTPRPRGGRECRWWSACWTGRPRGRPAERPASPTSASWPDAAPSRSRRTAATSAPSVSAC